MRIHVVGVPNKIGVLAVPGNDLGDIVFSPGNSPEEHKLSNAAFMSVSPTASKTDKKSYFSSLQMILNTPPVHSRPGASQSHLPHPSHSTIMILSLAGCKSRRCVVGILECVTDDRECSRLSESLVSCRVVWFGWECIVSV
jgi:hypothetical protein